MGGNIMSGFKARAQLYIEKIINGSAVAGWLVIIVMMLWGTGDVILQLFRHSLPATYAWTEILNVVAVSLPLAYVASKKGHIVITLLTRRFVGKRKHLIDVIVLALTFVFSAFLAWQLSVQAWHSLMIWEFDQVTIKIYWFPAKIALGLGFIGTAIIVAFQIIGEFLGQNRDSHLGNRSSGVPK
jgi:TRAP-type C4-dicarboxylate transport system permease small subunit